MSQINNKIQRRKKLYRSAVTFFDDPIKYTGIFADFWFVDPVRKACDGSSFLPVFLVALFPGPWIIFGLTGVFLCLLAFTLQSSGKLLWDTSNFISSELFDFAPCKPVNPFDNQDDLEFLSRQP